MALMKNSPEILGLSELAQAILAGHWGFAKGSTLTLQNQKSRLTASAAEAMSELVAAGIVADNKADDGYAESRTYSLTDKGRSAEFRKPISWMDKHGKISITEPIPTPTDR